MSSANGARRSSPPHKHFPIKHLQRTRASVRAWDHLRGSVHFVHNVHFVHYLGKPNWLQLPDSGSR